MDSVVLSLGGSVIVNTTGVADYLKKLARVLVDVSANHKLFVVTGGGRIARFYINCGRELGSDEVSLDEMGIEVTRLNARLLIAALGDGANQDVPEDYDEAFRAGKKHSIVVMGGVSPGITTDAVSSFLAERVKAERVVNATAVDGAYTADPKKYPNAKKIPRMSHGDLVALVSGDHSRAGPHGVFDSAGAKALEKSGIPLFIVDGTNLKNLRNAIEGKKFNGTIVDG